LGVYVDGTVGLQISFFNNHAKPFMRLFPSLYRFFPPFLLFTR